MRGSDFAGPRSEAIEPIGDKEEAGEWRGTAVRSVEGIGDHEVRA
jgi:hypothetical protein